MTTDTVGGVWTFTRELAKELLHRGHYVCLVSFGRAPSQEQNAVTGALQRQYANRFHYEASSASLEWMQENAAAYSGGERLLLSLAQTHGSEVLLTSQFCYGALPLSLPKIVVAHSDVLSWAAACGEPLNAASIWLRTYRALVQRGLDAADAVVAPTRAYLLALCGHFKLDEAKAGVIANGRTVDQGEVSDRMLQAVSAGRTWDKAKGLALLSEVHAPMSITIAGERVGDEGPTGMAHWIGPQTEADLMRIFRKSALYLCTSVYEPFGLAPLEAALCGCAVVARDIPVLREVWGDSALYFQSAGVLEELLCTLRDDPHMLRDMQARAQVCALTYTAARMAEQYVQLSYALQGSREVIHAK